MDLCPAIWKLVDRVYCFSDLGKDFNARAFIVLLDYFGLILNMDIIRILIGGAVGSSVYLFTAFLFKFGSFFELSKLIFKK